MINGPPNPSPGVFEHSLGDERNQIRFRLHNNLKQVPGVVDVHYAPSQLGIEVEVVGDLDPEVYAEGAVSAESAEIAVNWWPQHDEEDRSWFKFHYHESSGFDVVFTDMITHTSTASTITKSGRVTMRTTTTTR